MEEELSLEQIKTWKAQTLKDFLRKRNLKVYGKKEELVARVFAAFEQNFPISTEASANASLTKSDVKSMLVTPQGILPDPDTLENGWIGEIEGMVKWPPVYLCDITMYIMKDHPGNDISLQKRLLNEYKEGKAYRLYEEGWLKEIYIHSIADSSSYCFLKAKCTPSMKLNNSPHTLWICAKKQSGEIHCAYCSCTAGLGGSCIHITAMFFRIEAAVRNGHTNLACTSQPSVWNVPPKKTKINPVRAKDFDFKKSKFNKVSTRSAAHITRKLFNPLAKKHTDSDNDNLSAMHDSLKSILPSNNCLSAFFPRQFPLTYPGVEIDCITEVPVENNGMVKPDPHNIIIKLAQQASTVDEFFCNMPVFSESQVKDIESSTVGQSSNEIWIEQRKGRLTASNFYSVFTRVNTIQRDTERKHNLEPLIKKVMGYHKTNCANIPALKHGVTYEPVARNKYIELTQASHDSFRYRECGLFVDQDKPYLAASPDLLIQCSCCGAGLAEFKCPLSIAQEIPSSDNLDYLVLVDGVTKLKEDHAYFAQVQGQLALTKRKYCDFFVFTHIGTFNQRIYFSENYWTKILHNLDYFFKNYLAEELIKM